jgi:glucose uptake protein GlcU
MSVNQNKGFFGKLFDFSFSSFIAPQIVGILYVLALISGVLFALSSVFAAFQYGGFTRGLGTLVISTFGFLVYTILIRVSLESFIALIRTAESTRILAENVLNNTANPDLSL